MKDDPGEDFTRVCPRCQTANPSRSRFCLRCGSSLAAAPPIEEPPASVAPSETAGADAAMRNAPAAIAVTHAGDTPGIGAYTATEDAHGFAPAPTPPAGHGAEATLTSAIAAYSLDGRAPRGARSSAARDTKRVDDGATRVTFPGPEAGMSMARRREEPARRRLPMVLAAVIVVIGAALAAWLVAGGHFSNYSAPATPTVVPTPRPKATAIPVQKPGSWRIVPVPAPGHPPLAPPAGSYPIARAFGGYLAYQPPATIITPTHWPIYADQSRHLTLAYPPGWRQVSLARGMGILFLAPSGAGSATLPGGLPGVAVSWISGARLPVAGDPALLDLGSLSAGNRTGHLYSIGGAGVSAFRLVVPARAGTLTLYARADSPALLDDFWRMLATLRLE